MIYLTPEITTLLFLDTFNGVYISRFHCIICSYLQQLTGEMVTADHALTALNGFFSSRKRKPPTLLFADELDLLSTRNQKVLYNLLSWPGEGGSRLIVLAVANTMDLPDRILQNKKLPSRMVRGNVG